MENTAVNLQATFRERQNRQKETIYNIFEKDPALVEKVHMDAIKDSVRQLAKERDALREKLTQFQKQESKLDANLTKADSEFSQLSLKDKQDIKKKIMTQYQLEQSKSVNDSKKLTMLSGIYFVILFLQLGSFFVL